MDQPGAPSAGSPRSADTSAAVRAEFASIMRPIDPSLDPNSLSPAHIKVLWTKQPLEVSAEVGLQLAVAFCRWLPTLRSSRKSLFGNFGRDLIRKNSVQSLIPASGELASEEVGNNPTLLRRDSAISMVEHGPVQFTSKLQKNISDVDGNMMINQFLVLDDLGRGAQGKIHLAYDTVNEELRAVKVVKRSRVDQMRRDSTLQQEVAVLKKLRHKNVVALHEVIDDPASQKLYLILQYIDSGPVSKTFEGQNGLPYCQPIPASDLANYARQICSGLAYLHRHGIVHRDIKPDNLLRDRGGTVYISDFGVSELCGKPSSEAGSMKTARLIPRGTPAFFAPELFDASSNEVGGEALDIWSLGVTFYLLLVGQVPWGNEAGQPFDEQVRTGPLEFPECVPTEWRKIIRDMLEKDPRRRVALPELRARIKKLEGQIATGGDFSLITKGELDDALTRLKPVTPCPLPRHVTRSISSNLEAFGQDEKSDGTPRGADIKFRAYSFSLGGGRGNDSVGSGEVVRAGSQSTGGSVWTSEESARKSALDSRRTSQSSDEEPSQLKETRVFGDRRAEHTHGSASLVLPKVVVSKDGTDGTQVVAETLVSGTGELWKTIDVPPPVSMCRSLRSKIVIVECSDGRVQAARVAPGEES